MSETLPDSGGAYYDADTGGVVSIIRRNVGEAKSSVASGSAGATAAGVAVGVAALPAAKYVAEKAGFM